MWHLPLAAAGPNQQAAFQAQVARNNAFIQQQLATDALRRGEEAADAIRRRNAQAKGLQRSAVAAAVVVVDQDAPLDLLLDAAEPGESDVLTGLENSRREAFQFQVGATNDLAQASLFDAQRSSPLLAAGGTLLTGIGTSILTFNSPLNSQVPRGGQGRGPLIRD
jgi:hypothetical protein